MYNKAAETHLNNLLESNITGAKNKHMTHIEDLVVLGGKEGIEHALETFYSLFEELEGSTPKSERKVSIKIDGAPAVFVWNSFPGLPAPGLSMKGLFAKTPKAAFTEQEVIDVFGRGKDGSIRTDLVTKLTTLLRYIPMLNIPEGEIWQGDFLYDASSLGRQMIDDEPHITFHPNTIVYAVPEQSEIGNRIRESEVGVVWHTVYKGAGLEDARASFSASASNLANVPQVFSTDPYVKSIAGQVTMTAEETSEASHLIEYTTELASSLVDNPSYNEFIDNAAYIQLFNQFQNYVIRQGGSSLSGDEFGEAFIEWGIPYLEGKKEKEIEKVKTEKSKEAKRVKFDAMIQEFRDNAERYVDVIDDASTLIHSFTQLKAIFTKKLDALGSFNAYLKKHSGEFERTGQEGFAVSDTVGNVVKFVDRSQFSMANFSPDYVKGWENTRVSESLLKEDFSPENIDIHSPDFAGLRPAQRKAVLAAKAKQDADRITKPHNLEPRTDSLSQNKALTAQRDEPTFAIEVEAPPGVARQAAAQNFVNDTDVKVEDYTIPTDKKRPTVVVDLSGYGLSLEFKNNAKTPDKLDAVQTAAMETAWARCMQAKNADTDYPSYEEINESFKMIDDDWYRGFKQGAELVDSELLDPGELYVFFRGDTIIMPDGTYFDDASLSLHANIDRVFQARRDVFGTRMGSKKDAWNPSDIYCCKQSLHASLLDEWLELEKNATTIIEFNTFLIRNQDTADLIGISLKKPANPPHASEANMDPENIPTDTYQMSSIKLDLNVPPSLASGAITMVGSTGKVIEGAIRYFGESKKGSNFGGALTLELKEKGAKAQLGKVPVGIFKVWAENYNIVVPDKHAALGFLAVGLHEVVDEVKAIATAFPQSGITPEAYKSFVLQARDKYADFFEMASGAGFEARQAISTAKTEKQKVQLEKKAVKAASAEMKDLFTSYSTNDDMTRDLVYLSQIPMQLAFLGVIANAKLEGEDTFQEFMNSIINGAKKIGPENAPFVKIS